jgi:thioesterase domain-containing protein
MWERLAAGGLEVVPIPGLHKTILQQPHVRELARILDAHLETAEKITSSSL